MKFLKKINKGVILTCIVLLILVIYLFNVELQRNKDKPEIEKVCRDYIELVNKFAVTPENVSKVYAVDGLNEEEKKAKNDLVELAINANMSTLKSNLTDKMIDNELAVRMQKDRIEEFVQDNTDPFTSTLAKFDKEITKIKKFSFDGDQVTVTFSTNTETETKYLDSLDNNKEVSNKNSETSEETITLQNIDGAWKVVYADLYFPGNGASYMSTFTTMY